jgi:hypothetical protein
MGRSPMPEPKPFLPAVLPADSPPLLVVVIDTEEEFDWQKRFDRGNRSVTCIPEQLLAQEVFARFGITPTYVVDHPVADTDSSAQIFKKLLAEKACLVGAHLHPWVNPPFDEEVNEVNSYPGNLAPDLEFCKLEILTETIEKNIGQRPVIYKAGRYGYGPATTAALLKLGYKIDASVVPHSDLRPGFGPDFRGLPDQPYWAGPKGELFELPLSCGFAGLFGRFGGDLFPTVGSPLATRLHLPGIAARTALLERIMLTPEGITLDEQKRLVRAMAGRGRKVFSYTYHSSSLLAGGSPYVRSVAGRDQFLEKMEKFFLWFFNEMGGKPSNPLEVMDLCLKAKGQAA